MHTCRNRRLKGNHITTRHLNLMIGSNDLTVMNLLMSHKGTNQSVNFVQLSQPMKMSHDVTKFLTVETIIRKTFMKYHAELTIIVIHKCITVSFKCLKISFEYFSPNRFRAGNSTQQSCQDGSCRFMLVALHKHKLFLVENFLMEAVTDKVSFQTV